MAAIKCQDCGKTANRSGPARFCMPCAMARQKRKIGVHSRGLVEALTPLRGEDGFVCMDCAGPVIQSVCGGRKTRPALRCWDCNRQHREFKALLSGKDMCGREVHKAKRAGLLKPATEFACVDCSQPATEYDHRDYNRPLDVEPVCRSCNVVRGAAIPFNPFLVGALLLGAACHPSPHSVGGTSSND